MANNSAIFDRSDWAAATCDQCLGGEKFRQLSSQLQAASRTRSAPLAALATKTNFNQLVKERSSPFSEAHPPKRLAKFTRTYTMLSRGPQQIVVARIPTHYPLWLLRFAARPEVGRRGECYATDTSEEINSQSERYAITGREA